jgi:eukaryotic-like serine/threonine-protein kinase
MTEPRVLGERYELAELLGQGGMAEVFRARDARLGRNVAVKVLRADLARDPSFEKRFEREAQAAAGMQHPNVVAVFDTGTEVEVGTTVPYIVMEYVDGTTLKELLSTGRRLLPQRALEITGGVLSALDYSHQRGVVHRDIKPANVMLTRTGEVKVMDFGIARAIDDAQATMTQASTVMGTAQYLSPEQGRGEKADARSDIYATGCLLYELLTSRPPFSGDTTESVIYQHVRENPVPPSQIDPEVPAAIDAIVLKAMSKNPDNRYQTAAEMRADVLRAISGEPVRATPLLEETTAIPMTQALPLPGGDDTPEKSRRGAYIGLAAAVVGVLLIAGFFLLRPLFNAETTVSVPDLRGLTVAQAIAALEADGLTLGVQTPKPSSAAEGKIIAQTPQFGAEAAEGSAVAVDVSTGPAKAVVPNIVGLSLDAASQRLETAGLTLGAQDEVNSDKNAGTVLEASPAEGTSVDAGSAVDVKVSNGRVAVPNVVSKTESQANSILVEAGFQVAITRTKTTDSLIVGRVISQSPEEGATVKAGATITITVAELAPTQPPTTQAPPPATPATTP